MNSATPVVGIVMGSNSDWDTMKNAAQILADFGVPFEAQVVSAHRMPDDMFRYAESARGRGLQAIIAGAGGAAHLPGMLAAKTPVPVLGVPVASKHLQGVDSLHSIVQMPKACRWRRSRSAWRGRPTRRCSPSRCWRTTTRGWPRRSTPSVPARLKRPGR